jgi:hypothetical protein
MFRLTIVDLLYYLLLSHLFILGISVIGVYYRIRGARKVILMSVASVSAFDLILISVHLLQQKPAV